MTFQLNKKNLNIKQKITKIGFKYKKRKKKPLISDHKKTRCSINKQQY